MSPQPEGERLSWEQVPRHVQSWVEQDLSAPVVEAVNQPSGFSPGAAARLLLADGRRVFVKAACATPNPETQRLHRREAIVAAALPTEVPAPKLLSNFDDGDWVALCFVDVAGNHPVNPWTKNELDRS